jgi:hypothetical protein
MTIWRCATWVLLSFVLAATQATALPDPGEHVIITVAAFAGEFQRLADYRMSQGMSSSVVTLEWIESNVAPGEDLPATIRNFIRFAHDEWGTRWVLLGGDADVVPARFCMQSPYGSPIPFPADLYYACLDGTWNADGDGTYGEGIDQVDYDTEVAVGRASVASLAEAALFVDKTIRYEQPVGVSGERALLVAGVLAPSPWHPGEPIEFDAAPFCEDLRARLESATRPIPATRLYENHVAFPGSVALTRASLLDSLASGRYSVVHCHVAGDSLDIAIGDEVVTAADLASLSSGPGYPFMSFNRSHGAAFDGDCLLEELMVSDTGGIAAGVGFSGYSYLSPSLLFVESWYVMFLAPGEDRLGDVWRAAGDRVLSFNQGSTTRTMLQGFTLLADPAMHRRGSVTAVPLAGTGGNLTVVSCFPNPCNPGTTISLIMPDDAQVEVAVFDLAGRRVRTLSTGRLPRGTARLRWDGSDDNGQPAASGVYLVSARSGGNVAWRHLTLVR